MCDLPGAVFQLYLFPKCRAMAVITSLMPFVLIIKRVRAR